MQNTCVVLRWISLGLILLVLGGCHTDPNVRKHKYFESGNRYAAKSKYREAAIQYANAIKVDKNYGDAHYALAKTYTHLGELRDAYMEFVRTVDLQPSNYPARLELGKIDLLGGRLEKAKAQATAILAAEPKNADAYALLASVAMTKGDMSQASEQIQHALDIDPSRATFHEQAAVVGLRNNRDPAEVEAELKTSVRLDSNSAEPRLLLAMFYLGKQRWPEAEQTCREAIAVDPKSVQSRQLLAQILLREGKAPVAEDVLRQTQKDLASDPRGQRVLADYYMRSGQFDKARSEFSALVSTYPNNLALKEDYVRALLQVQDWSTAQSVLDGLMKSKGTNPQVLGLHGILLLNSGKVDQAVVALQSSVKDYPNDDFLLYWLGKAARAKGDVNLAKTAFGSISERSAFKLSSQTELAELAVSNGDVGLLSEVADKTIAAAPRFAGGYLWRGIVDGSRNRLDKAEADFKTAMELMPENATAYVELGKLRLIQKRIPEATALLQQALDRDPGQVEAAQLLVAEDLSHHQPEQAVALLDGLISKRPKSSGLYSLLAGVQVRRKDLARAATAAQTAMQINPADAEAALLFAQIQIARGHAADAVATWEKWSQSHPKDASAFALLGTFAEASGDKSKAAAYYKRALDIDPQQALAANNLSYLMLEGGENVDIALSLAQTARRAMPNSPNTADTLAWAYYHKAAYAFARDLLENALKIDGANPTIQYHLGMIYTKLGDKSSALTHLKRAIMLAPDSSAGKNATQALQALS